MEHFPVELSPYEQKNMCIEFNAHQLGEAVFPAGWVDFTNEHQQIFRTLIASQALRIDFNKEAPFIGRSKELKILHQCLEKAQKSQSQYIMLQGEIGIGKNRLIQFFFQQLPPNYTCTSIQVGTGIQFPYWIFKEILKDLMVQFLKTDSLKETDFTALVVQMPEIAIRLEILKRDFR